jgi:CheY-like chemotaxis protein
LAGERILVVDDGADMRDFVIKYVLKPNGYEYLEARDGLEGFEQIQAHSPDLVVMDLQMPRLDGLGLLHKLQEAEISVPIVLMTFYGSEEIAIEVFRLGVRDYVIKPFTEEELLGAIERSLMLTRLLREREDLLDRLATASRDLQRRVRDLQGLARVGKMVAAQPDVDTLITRIVEAASFLTGAERASLLLVDEAGTSLIQRGVRTSRGLVLTTTPVEDALAWRAVRSAQPVAGQPTVDASDGVRKVQLCAPIVAGTTAIGTLSAYLPAEAASEHQLFLLGSLADYAAIALK